MTSQGQCSNQHCVLRFLESLHRGIVDVVMQNLMVLSYGGYGIISGLHISYWRASRPTAPRYACSVPDCVTVYT